jgi:hypothetical protein
MAGTGGLKKMRCAAPGRGKSGGWRVLFADYPHLAKTILITAFPKSSKTDVSPSEKAALRDLKRELDETVGAE